jgi:glutaredoxin
MAEREVVIYTKNDCAYCQQEKEFLSEKGIEFIEKNIQEDQQAFLELVEMGYQTTPLTTIDGEVVVGFEPRELEEKLGL